VHLDVNYGIGAIAAEGTHFVQHTASASTGGSVGKHWSPYVEAYWVSKAQPDGRAAASIDAAAIYTISERIAVGGGGAFGQTASTNGPAIFGGPVAHPRRGGRSSGRACANGRRATSR
jgi:hypothetical protein